MPERVSALKLYLGLGLGLGIGLGLGSRLGLGLELDEIFSAGIISTAYEPIIKSPTSPSRPLPRTHTPLPLKQHILLKMFAQKQFDGKRTICDLSFTRLVFFFHFLFFISTDTFYRFQIYCLINQKFQTC